LASGALHIAPRFAAGNDVKTAFRCQDYHDVKPRLTAFCAVVCLSPQRQPPASGSDSRDAAAPPSSHPRLPTRMAIPSRSHYTIYYYRLFHN